MFLVTSVHESPGHVAPPGWCPRRSLNHTETEGWWRRGTTALVLHLPPRWGCLCVCVCVCVCVQPITSSWHHSKVLTSDSNSQHKNFTRADLHRGGCGTIRWGAYQAEPKVLKEVPPKRKPAKPGCLITSGDPGPTLLGREERRDWTKSKIVRNRLF